MTAQNPHSPSWPLVFASVAGAAVATLALTNVALGDKPVDHVVPTLYGADEDHCSRRVTYGGWKNRPLRQKRVERAASVLRSQL